jgi:iron complex transport system permease protein
MAKPTRLTPLNFSIRIFFLILLAIGSMAIGLMIGPVTVSLAELFRAIFSENGDPIIGQILFDIRLPRILFGLAVGGGLSIAGAVFQAILLNPLAEPYILGISSGGTFGAILSFLIGASFFSTQLFAFSGAVCVMLIVFLLGKRFGELEPNVLLLSGIMVGAFFSALILIMMSLLNDSLRTAIFWLIGNLSLAEKSNLPSVMIITLFTSFILVLMSDKFNVFSLGNDYAKQLGINTKRLKTTTYILTSILIGTIVSVSGIIGFVGLLIPHICRLLFGVDNRVVLPASFFIGGSFLILCDTIARTIIAPAEFPVGAITAIVGAPIFIYLLRKKFKIYF